MACRVVCGRLLTMPTFSPTMALVTVVLPALGRPTRQAKPLRYGSSGVLTGPVSHRAPTTPWTGSDVGDGVALELAVQGAAGQTEGAGRAQPVAAALPQHRHDG